MSKILMKLKEAKPGKKIKFLTSCKIGNLEIPEGSVARIIEVREAVPIIETSSLAEGYVKIQIDDEIIEIPAGKFENLPIIKA